MKSRGESPNKSTRLNTPSTSFALQSTERRLSNSQQFSSFTTSSSSRRLNSQSRGLQGTPSSRNGQTSLNSTPSNASKILSPMHSKRNMDRGKTPYTSSLSKQSFFAKLQNNPPSSFCLSPGGMNSYSSSSFSYNDIDAMDPMNDFPDANDESVPLKLPDFVLERISNTFKERKPIEDFRTMTNLHENFDMHRMDYGLNLSHLHMWSAQHARSMLSGEEAMQEKALAKMHGFIRAIKSALKIQTWYRMTKLRVAFRSHRQKRLLVRQRYFRAWKVLVVAERLHYFARIGKPFFAWRKQVSSSRRLNQLLGKVFNVALEKLTLNPQSLHLYFNQHTWGMKLSDADSAKIRRLILDKLFHAWRLESHMQRVRNARATQIISRMLRRSRGPLWMKEAQLVCFHMWRRYSAVRAAYRRQQVDPQFGYPYLPQWTQLMKVITITRTKKEHAQVIASSLCYKLWFSRWKEVKKLSESHEFLDDGEVADRHYHRSLQDKVLQAWYHQCRMKGKAFRLRLRIFVNWKLWSTKKRRMNEFKARTIFWMNRRRSRRMFDVLIDLCEVTMSRRIKAVKMLQQHMFDRKVLVCAHAFQDRNQHMFMLEYWRRWIIYRKNCIRWRATLLECRYSWYQTRNQVIFKAWRDYVKQQRHPDADEVQSHTSTTSLSGQLLSASLINIDSSKDHSKLWKPNSSIAHFACLVLHIYYSRPGFDILSEDTRSLLASSYHQPSSDDDKNQQRLDIAVEGSYPLDAARAIENGAIVSAHHIDMATRHLNDSYFLLASLLLTGGIVFLASTIINDSHDVVVMKCQSPVVAIMMSSHIRRWEKAQLTHRELQCLCDDHMIESVTGSSFQSIILWRALVLTTIRHHKDALKNEFCSLLPHNTEAECDREHAKRAIALRRRNLIMSLSSYYHVSEEVQDSVCVPDRHDDLQDTSRGRILFAKRKSFARRPAPLHDGYKDISMLLREYRTMEQAINIEAKRYRQPLLDRDEVLLKNGFIRQARNNFLTLREACKTPSEKAKEREEKIAKDRKLEELKRRDEERNMMRDRQLTSRQIDYRITHPPSHVVDYEKALVVQQKYLDPRELHRLTIDHVTENMYDREEMTEEESFNHRTCATKEVYLETYVSCPLDADDKDTMRSNAIMKMRELFAERRVIYCRNIINRLLQAFKRGGVIIPETSMHSISPWLVTAYLQNMTQSPQNAKIWQMLPMQWWDIQSIIFRVDRETNLLENLITSINQRLSSACVDKHAATSHRNQLASFITAEISQVTAVAIKQRQKVIIDYDEGAIIRSKLGKLQGNVTRLRNRIRSLKDELKRAEIMFAALNNNGVFEAFGLSIDDRLTVDLLFANLPSDHPARLGSYKKRSEYASMVLIESRRKMLQEVEEQLVEAMMMKQLGEVELHSYHEFCDRSNGWLRQLAQGKMMMIFDAYEVLHREEKHHEDLRRSAISDRRLLELLQCHLEELRQQQKFIHTEGKRISIIAEEVRFEELMRRRELQANQRVPDTATNEAITSLQLDLHNENKEVEVENNDFGKEFSIDSDFPGMSILLDHNDICGSAPSLTADDMPRELLPPTSPPVRPRWRNIPGLLLQDTSIREDGMNMQKHLQQLAEHEVKKASLTDQFREQVLREYWHLAQPEAIRSGPLSPIMTARSKKERHFNQSAASSQANSPVSAFSAESSYADSTYDPSDRAISNTRLMNRTGRMWKGVGTMYWRMKAERVREIILIERQRRIETHSLLFQPRQSPNGMPQSIGTSSTSSDVVMDPMNKKALVNMHLNDVTKSDFNNQTSSAMMHLGDEVWLQSSHAQLVKLSISFSAEEHPDRLIMQTAAVSRPGSRPGTPRGRKPSASQPSLTTLPSRHHPHGTSHKELRKAFILPDPFVSSGLHEYARIKATINHKAGINPWEGVSIIDPSIINSIMAGGNLTSHDSSSLMRTPSLEAADLKLGGGRQGRRRSSVGLSALLPRTNSHESSSFPSSTSHATLPAKAKRSLSGSHSDLIAADHKIISANASPRSSHQSTPAKNVHDHSVMTPPSKLKESPRLTASRTASPAHHLVKSPSTKPSSRRHSLQASISHASSQSASTMSTKHSSPSPIVSPSRATAISPMTVAPAAVPSNMMVHGLSPTSSTAMIGSPSGETAVDNSPDHIVMNVSTPILQQVDDEHSQPIIIEPPAVITNPMENKVNHINDEMLADTCEPHHQINLACDVLEDNQSIVSFACNLPIFDTIITEPASTKYVKDVINETEDESAKLTRIPTIAENLAEWRQWTSVDPSEQKEDHHNVHSSSRRRRAQHRQTTPPTTNLIIDTDIGSVLTATPSSPTSNHSTLVTVSHSLLESMNEKISLADIAAATASISTPVKPKDAMSATEDSNVPVFLRKPSREKQSVRLRLSSNMTSRPGFLKSNATGKAKSSSNLLAVLKPSLDQLVKAEIQSVHDSVFDPVVNERWLMEDEVKWSWKDLTLNQPVDVDNHQHVNPALMLSHAIPSSNTDPVTESRRTSKLTFSDSIPDLKPTLSALNTNPIDIVLPTDRSNIIESKRPSSARASSDRIMTFHAKDETSLPPRSAGTDLVAAIIDLDAAGKHSSPNQPVINRPVVKPMKRKVKLKPPSLVPPSFLAVLEANFKRLVDERLGIPPDPPPNQQLYKNTALAEAFRLDPISVDVDASDLQVRGSINSTDDDRHQLAPLQLKEMKRVMMKNAKLGAKKSINLRRHHHLDDQQKIFSYSLSALPSLLAMVDGLSLHGDKMRGRASYHRSHTSNTNTRQQRIAIRTASPIPTHASTVMLNHSFRAIDSIIASSVPSTADSMRSQVSYNMEIYGRPVSAGAQDKSAPPVTSYYHDESYDFLSTDTTRLESIGHDDESFGMHDVLNRLSKDMRQHDDEVIAPPVAVGKMKVDSKYNRSSGTTPIQSLSLAQYRQQQHQYDDMVQSSMLNGALSQDDGQHLYAPHGDDDDDTIWDEERDERLLMAMLKVSMSKESASVMTKKKAKPALLKPSHQLRPINHDLPPIVMDQELLVGRRVASAADMSMKRADSILSKLRPAIKTASTKQRHYA